MSILLIIAALIISYVIYIDIVYPYVVYPLSARRHGCGNVPCIASKPLGIPITITTLKQVKNENLLQWVVEKSFGGESRTVLRQQIGKWVVTTRDPENIKAILATKFKDFSLVERNSRMQPVFGSGIFTQDGSQWKHSREMLKPQFTRDQISRIENIGHHVDIMIDEIHKHGNQIELQHFFHLMTMDTATSFLFGESVDSLKFSEDSKGAIVEDPVTGEQVYSADFVESYTWLNKFALERIILNDLEWISVLGRPEHRRHLRVAQIFIDHYVHMALEATKDYVPGSDEIKDTYVFSRELAKETRDPIVIRDQIFNILIAGRDTTASTLSYAFHYFTNYPEVWKKVREDVWSVFPDGNATYATYEDLRKAKYLQMVIKEVLRLAPAVPLNMRTAVRDTFLPRGGGPNRDQPVYVPRGTTLNYATYVLHRDQQIYGPDSFEFKPERWAPENKMPNSPMYSWGYIPFNAGPRICLGQQFALTEIAFTIVKLALAFEKVEPDSNFNPKLTDRYTLTTMVGGTGVPVILS